MLIEIDYGLRILPAYGGYLVINVRAMREQKVTFTKDGVALPPSNTHPREDHESGITDFLWTIDTTSIRRAHGVGVYFEGAVFSEEWGKSSVHNHYFRIGLTYNMHGNGDDFSPPWGMSLQYRKTPPLQGWRRTHSLEMGIPEWKEPLPRLRGGVPDDVSR